VHLDRQLTWSKHKIQKASPGPPAEEIILDSRAQISTVRRKQTPPLQGSPETYLDLRDPVMGNGVNLQHRNPRKVSSQSTQNHHGRTMVHPEFNATPRPTCLFRQAHSATLQHHLPLPDSTAPQQTDTTADPRTLLHSEAQAKAPAGPANHSLVNSREPQWTQPVFIDIKTSTEY
jgi:hypothetical protein